jgi:L,D-peptidoglycan transpeptidase YkuD (ErfK/YbiS/YcfS/YnhG family)
VPGQGGQPASGSAGRTVAALVPHGPNPCVFVSAATAQAIIGAPIVRLTEAPLGPTCVLKLKGQRQITIAVETQRIAAQVRYMHKRRHLVLGGHQAYCGILGRSMLDVKLSGGRILNITAPCSVAEALAARALRHITA